MLLNCKGDRVKLVLKETALIIIMAINIIELIIPRKVTPRPKLILNNLRQLIMMKR